VLRLADGPLSWPWIDPEKALPWVADRIGLALAESQTTAIKLALVSKVLVITGGPGVGKTTIVKGILRILAAKGVQLLLCAPTGRAAKRMSARTTPRIVLADRGTTATGTANPPLRQRLRIEILLAAIDRRPGEPRDLRDDRQTGSTSALHLRRREQAPPPIVEQQADHVPSQPDGPQGRAGTRADGPGAGKAGEIAATKLYDRTKERLTLDEVERIRR
jgi:hypothetical protein